MTSCSMSRHDSISFFNPYRQLDSYIQTTSLFAACCHPKWDCMLYLRDNRIHTNEMARSWYGYIIHLWNHKYKLPIVYELIEKSRKIMRFSCVEIVDLIKSQFWLYQSDIWLDGMIINCIKQNKHGKLQLRGYKPFFYGPLWSCRSVRSSQLLDPFTVYLHSLSHFTYTIFTKSICLSAGLFKVILDGPWKTVIIVMDVGPQNSV